MSIEPGYYYIQNREQYVGHSDESTGPQRVIVLPEGVKAPKWKVDRVEGDRYTIQVEESDGSYAPAAKVDDKVFVKTDNRELWYIIPDERGGKDSFVIAAVEDRYNGWVAPEEPEDQILYRILIVGPSFPPFYPPNETFQFSRVDDD